MTRIRAGQVNSESAAQGQLLTADGAGRCDWKDPASGPGGAYWEPLTNGNAEAPELIFADGDVIMVRGA